MLGLLNVRNDFLNGTRSARGGQAGQRERSAHQLHEVAAADAVIPFRRGLGELAIEHLAELSRVRKFVEAAVRPAADRGAKLHLDLLADAGEVLEVDVFRALDWLVVRAASAVAHYSTLLESPSS